MPTLWPPVFIDSIERKWAHHINYFTLIYTFLGIQMDSHSLGAALMLPLQSEGTKPTQVEYAATLARKAGELKITVQKLDLQSSLFLFSIKKPLVD
jgi:hypothetical protein